MASEGSAIFVSGNNSNGRRRCKFTNWLAERYQTAENVRVLKQARGGREGGRRYFVCKHESNDVAWSRLGDEGSSSSSR